jgi:hypothetical protein
MISGQEAETADIAADMIFLSHMGKVEIPDPIVVVEADQELAVSDRNVSGHGHSPGYAFLGKRWVRSKQPVAGRL